jgi:hypothetical protein
MDAHRFDAIAKTLAEVSTRRKTIGALFAGAVAIATQADVEDALAANKRNCKKPCGECQICNRGRCKRKRNGQKRCRRGKCVNLADGATCGNGGSCQNGTCVCPPGGQLCGGRCVNACLGPNIALNPFTCTCCGTAGNPVTCPGGGVQGSCCSGVCNPGGQVCMSLVAGQSCSFGAQCASGTCQSNGLCA